MLILFVHTIDQQNNETTSELYQLLASKIPRASVETISHQEALESAFDLTQPALFLTQDAALAAYLREKGSEVIYWYDLSELSLKLDMFLQLQRYIADYPLTLKDWTLREVLSQSDDAIIYRAVDVRGRQVAIKRFKFLPSCLTEKMIHTLLDEINEQCGSQVNGLVKFYDGGISDQAFYLIMEYLPYGTLRQTLNGCGNDLPLPHALAWFQEIVIALDCVHKAGLIHRDLKIDNILMREDGSLALTSYGVAKRLFLDAGYMHEQELYCSPHYVSPEQISGDACTQASDIYSLGVIFFELLTGRKPYAARQAHELMMHHVMAPVPTLPNELSRFQSMLDKMMAKNPADRYASAMDALENLPIAA